MVAAGKRGLVWLALITLALVGLNVASIALSDGKGSWVPKLALDLEGGTQVILEAQLPDGNPEPNQAQMQQAVSIIRERVDAAGVSESEITTQGQRNIVVAMPGEMDPQTRKRIQDSAVLNMRPVLISDSAATTQIIPKDQLPEKLNSTPTTKPTDASDRSYITEALYVKFIEWNCAKDKVDPAKVKADEPIVTCSTDGTEKYILGPVEVRGADIINASAGLRQGKNGVATNEWAVNLEFNEQGTKEFAEVTKRLNGYLVAGDPSRSQFAVTLDNLVIVAPQSRAVIVDGKSEITGTFTEEEAKELANQLKFGSLPFNFKVQSSSTISATLGSQYLLYGLIAGLVGLLLVFVYSLFQYRLLGFVTIASLLATGGVTYLLINYLSVQEGYRLSLAGVAGLGIAIGITADSFIVFFERVKDELREGRTVAGAVEAGWKRALRTILAARAVNFLIAIVLFFLAVGNVRGFAITLGLTTLADLVVVLFFTFPTLRLLANSRFFGEGHPWSGLDPVALGAQPARRVVPGKSGAVQRAKPVLKQASPATSSGKPLTIAERKRLERQQRQKDGDVRSTVDTETSDSSTQHSSDTSAAKKDGEV